MVHLGKGGFLSTNIQERLDKGVATLKWMDIFPWFSLEHLSHLFSDHCLILVDTMGKFRHHKSCKSNPFHFEAKWCLDNSFEKTVRKVWAIHNDNLPVNLKKRLSTRIDQDPIDEVLAEILEVQLGLNFEADKEEVFWSQRARVNWLQNGDRNTSSFHKAIMARHNHNRILGLEDESSQWVSDPEDILRVALKHFGDLFMASDSGGDDRVLDLVEKRISSSMN
ncbi:reverse transcriptase [Gossypium australe]|uniref:Reverse transcriptase n=1 Tax=Gossypium australe TaxID=47621 RepID=A0A5B6WPC5_9ROSI|nr:reverse transcriptase [Gossypium australe]